MLLDADRVQVCIVVCERLGREIARRRGRRHPDLVSESMVQHRVCVCGAHARGAHRGAVRAEMLWCFTVVDDVSIVCVRVEGEQI